MKGVTSKLLMSLVVISMALIALSTVTLAWFTLSNTAIVNDFELSIVQDDGLEIRIVQDSLDYDSGWLVNAKVKIDGNLVPLTTLDGINFKDFEFNTASKKNYISFKAYFRSKSNCKVNLSKMISSSSESLFRPTVDVILNEDGSYITYGPDQSNKVIRSVSVADAFRASFITNEEQYIYIFNKNIGQGSYNGFQYNDSWYNPAIAYYNAINRTSLTIPFKYGVYINDVLEEVEEIEFLNSDRTDLYLYNVIQKSTRLKIITMNSNLVTLQYNNLTDYYENSLEVNIWLEGWDADCFDAINKTTLNMIMGFEKENLD